MTTTSPLACLCLAGPTASGKTAAALAIAAALAAHRPVEIISVDSALVYRSMDIGTAKPTLLERAQVPHHLIDIIDPAQAYSAARFIVDAQRLIGDITARGHLPLLVGGTMLYFKALWDGIDEMPAADPAVRAALNEQATLEGWPALHAELARIDPVTAARLAPADSQRVQRALEVFRVSGQTLSSFHRAKTEPINPPTLLSLEPENRSWLHGRIAQRFQAMLADGLVDEVRSLRARSDLHADLPSMRCVGYRQVWEALDAADPSGDAHSSVSVDTSVNALAEKCIAATRQLAKRQITWLRGMPWRETVPCDAPDATAQVVTLARRWAQRQPA